MAPIRSAIAACMLSAQAAMACPVAADLARGIVVTESDGVTHLFRDGTGGVVTVETDFQDGSFGKNQLARGVYVLRLAIEDAGVLDLASVYVTTYRLPAADLPLPQPGLEQVFLTTVTSSTESYKERQEQVWGDVKPVTIGDCTLNSISGTVRYQSDLDSFTETILYLPTLGIGLLESYAFDGETPDVYSFESIAAAQ